MPYKPSHVANSYLHRANTEGISIDHLKMQKLVYFLHGWFLAVRKEPVVGEQFEAWPYGPVLASLYHEFKIHGRSPIRAYAIDIDPRTGEQGIFMVGIHDKKFYDVFDRVWERYKTHSGLDLSSLTHASGTPWDIARQRKDTYLSDDDIEKYFMRIAEKAHD